MINTAQLVYLDEAGFTGDHLLDLAQPMFVYAGVAMTEEQAAALHSEVTTCFQLRGNELKGSSLVKHKRGRQAVSWLLERSVEHSLIVVSNKRYALAGKFYEYIFEPLLAHQSAMLYAIGFHQFVAMVLYCHFAAGDSNAESLLIDFETLVRTLDPQQVEAVVSHLDDVGLTGPLGYLLTIALCQRDKIKKEIESLRGMEDEPKWGLDLSTPSVHYLLAAWGERFDALEVHCDRSKPIRSDLLSDISWFNQMIDRRDKVYSPVGKPESPSMVYNLAGPIQLEDSHNSPGIQIADVIASSVAYALNNPDDELSEKWLELAQEMVAETIRPDYKHIDLSLEGPNISSAVLRELHERSIKGKALLAGLGDFILDAKSNYPSFVLDTEPDSPHPSNI